LPFLQEERRALLEEIRRLALVSGGGTPGPNRGHQERLASGRARKDELVRCMELVDPR